MKGRSDLMFLGKLSEAEEALSEAKYPPIKT